MSENVLQIKGLRTQFATQDGTVTAVDGLSLDVASSEIVGLVGESGCGKSTAALSVMRLIPHPGRITAGQIIVDGRDVVPLDESAMRRVRGAVVAMVFQDALAALDPTMKIGAQLMEPLQIHLHMSAREAQERAIELLNRVGIPSPKARLDDYPHQFSGGMRQRVMIAMALSCSPRVLLADEPTTALDVTVQRQILDLIVSLRDETQNGVILVTHDVLVVAETCDRVVVMYAGRAVESGPTETVFRNPRHPYTAGLLGCTLALGRDRRKQLAAVPGMPPDLIDLPPGCAFAPRCLRAGDKCRQETPSLVTVDAGHEVACWHPHEPTGQTAPANRGNDGG